VVVELKDILHILAVRVVVVVVEVVEVVFIQDHQQEQFLLIHNSAVGVFPDVFLAVQHHQMEYGQYMVIVEVITLVEVEVLEVLV
jgi:hypothetical protein